MAWWEVTIRSRKKSSLEKRRQWEEREKKIKFSSLNMLSLQFKFTAHCWQYTMYKELNMYNRYAFYHLFFTSWSTKHKKFIFSICFFNIFKCPYRLVSKAVNTSSLFNISLNLDFSSIFIFASSFLQILSTIIWVRNKICYKSNLNIKLCFFSSIQYWYKRNWVWGRLDVMFIILRVGSL